MNRTTAASLIAPMASWLIQTMISSLINPITGTGQEGGFRPLLALPLMIKPLEKCFERTERWYNNMDKNFGSAPSFKHYGDN